MSTPAAGPPVPQGPGAPVPPAPTLGGRVRQRRAELKLPIDILAAVTAVPANVLDAIENDVSVPGEGTLTAIAKALNCSADYLGGGVVVTPTGPPAPTNPVAPAAAPALPAPAARPAGPVLRPGDLLVPAQLVECAEQNGLDFATVVT